MQIFMRTLLSFLLLPTLGFAAQSTEGNPSILVDHLPGEQAEEIWAWTQELIDEGSLAGASAQVIRKGKVVYRGVHGELELNSGRLVQGDSIFRIYSMTKAITSVAVMQLIEQGQLKLDDPIHKYLPEWKNVTVLHKKDDGSWGEIPASTAITVRHLLRHTSGLTAASFDRGELGRRYRKAQKNNAIESLDDFSRLLATLPLKHQPGAAWTYGHSTNILGRLIEVIAKKPFDTYVQEEIFDPLGMIDTHFRISDEDLPRLASVHETGDDKKVIGVAKGYLEAFRKPRPIPLGASGLVSTLEDYGRFQAMLLANGKYADKQILKPETVALMLDPNDGKAQIPMARFGLGFMLKGSKRTPLEVRFASWSGIARTYFVNDHLTETGSLLFTQTIPFNFKPGSGFQKMVQKVLETE
ncbi:MAG: hypothetical protein COA70_13310 [Planctomycetota bacterium]|nr:MAG: hypothetical protein COA70_13310 [Planctomycetota bacterium]